uniref:Complement C1r n=1 Tax=Myotis myotis TaxID=51298 RepID=A0A7J7Z0K0_MYOMY|nr:complement C1r [Myotis myotis]
MNVLPSKTHLRRIPSPCANTFVTTTLVATSVPAVQAMSFRRTDIPARLNAAASCTQSHRATCPAWSTPGPTLLTCAATTASGWSGATLSTSSSWILTAAHTLYPKEHNAQANASIDVFLGHINVEEITKLANHPVRRVSIHPDYRQDESHNFEGDIALLELENSVTLGPNLLPICLPDNETFYDSGLMGYVSGFGIMEERIANNLRFVRLPVANRGLCEAWLKGKNRNDVFSQNMFCAGDPTLKQDACQGDSGGVFAVRDPNTDRWVATGIVSWGIGCSRGYGFYTKLLNYVDWIKKEMEEEG